MHLTRALILKAFKFQGSRIESRSSNFEGLSTYICTVLYFSTNTMHSDFCRNFRRNTIDYGFWPNFQPNTIHYHDFWPKFHPDTIH